MSGFPPPNSPKKELDNYLVSPFSLDESAEDEQSQSDIQKSQSGYIGQNNQTSSNANKPSSPRLTSRNSQSQLKPELPDPSALAKENQQQSHTSPVVTIRTNEKGVQPSSSPPRDLPPQITQIKTGRAGTTNAYPASPRATTTTANTTTTTTTTTKKSVSGDASIQSGENKSKTASFSYRLPELEGVKGKRIISYSKLAKQLIYADSQNYKKSLKGSSIDSILRGKVWLKIETDNEGKSVDQPDEENVISQFTEPFMTHYFDTPAMKENLDQVTENYKEKANEAQELYKKIGAHNFNRNDDVSRLMQPIIAPLTGYIFGEKNAIKTSKMPAPVLAAMLALDEEVQLWSQENGSGDADELARARRNALKGIFGVRAFIPDYAIGLSQDETVDEGHYRPLVGFLMAYLNKNFDEFLDSVLNCSEEDRDFIKRQAAIVESRPVLPKSEREKLDQTKEKLQAKKPSSLFHRLKDAMGGVASKTDRNEVTSPRRELQRRGTLDREVETASIRELKSPRSAVDDKKNQGLEQASGREIKKTRERQHVLNEYLKKLDLNSVKNLPELGDILRGINGKIKSASANEYKNFTTDPDRFFHNFLQTMISDIQAKGELPSEGLQKYYLELSAKLGIDGSE